MTIETIPVFINGRPARVSSGSTLRQLVAQEEPELASAVETGTASATDARGLPVAAETVLSAGSIVRVFRSSRTAAPSVDA